MIIKVLRYDKRPNSPCWVYEGIRSVSIVMETEDGEVTSFVRHKNPDSLGALQVCNELGFPERKLLLKKNKSLADKLKKAKATEEAQKTLIKDLRDKLKKEQA